MASHFLMREKNGDNFCTPVKWCFFLSIHISLRYFLVHDCAASASEEHTCHAVSASARWRSLAWQSRSSSDHHLEYTQCVQEGRGCEFRTATKFEECARCQHTNFCFSPHWRKRFFVLVCACVCVCLFVFKKDVGVNFERLRSSKNAAALTWALFCVFVLVCLCICACVPVCVCVCVCVCVFKNDVGGEFWTAAKFKECARCQHTNFLLYPHWCKRLFVRVCVCLCAFQKDIGVNVEFVASTPISTSFLTGFSAYLCICVCTYVFEHWLRLLECECAWVFVFMLMFFCV